DGRRIGKRILGLGEQVIHPPPYRYDIGKAFPTGRYKILTALDVDEEMLHLKQDFPLRKRYGQAADNFRHSRSAHQGSTEHDDIARARAQLLLIKFPRGRVGADGYYRHIMCPSRLGIAFV